MSIASKEFQKDLDIAFDPKAAPIAARLAIWRLCRSICDKALVSKNYPNLSAAAIALQIRNDHFRN